MASFKLTLAYDGTDFSGWQAQPGRRTVQGELERAWREITGETVRVTAAGRTDAGVHAAGQVVGVESATRLEPPALLLALNAKLPEDAVVRDRRTGARRLSRHARRQAQALSLRDLSTTADGPSSCGAMPGTSPTPLDVDAMHAPAPNISSARTTS